MVIDDKLSLSYDFVFGNMPAKTKRKCSGVLHFFYPFVKSNVLSKEALSLNKYVIDQMPRILTLATKILHVDISNT